MSRDAILSHVRKTLSGGRSNDERRSAVEARLANPAKHLVPARVARTHKDLVSLFKSFLTIQGATVIDVANASDIPSTVADYLRNENLPARIRMGADPHLAAIAWNTAAGLTLETGPAEPDDCVGVSRAEAGVAETGTLVLSSGADNPVTLAFLPETHIVILARTAIVGSYEDACDVVGKGGRDAPSARTINFISGPSRTGDIGGRLVLGAHGPRRMMVLIVGEDDAENAAA